MVGFQLIAHYKSAIPLLLSDNFLRLVSWLR